MSYHWRDPKDHHDATTDVATALALGFVLVAVAVFVWVGWFQ